MELLTQWQRDPSLSNRIWPSVEHDFWHSLWADKEINFHEGEPNSLLVSHFPRLGLEKGDRVFLPLCGKTRDIAWLLDRGCRVAGAELNVTAVEELFEELGVKPRVEELDELHHYSAPDLDIYLGDIFHLSKRLLGPVHGVYDRAALVALPPETRVRYTAHLREITVACPQLLITFEYDQSQMEGPPFSIPLEEIESHYDDVFEIETLEVVDVQGFKGVVDARESIFRLSQTSRARDWRGSRSS